MKNVLHNGKGSVWCIKCIIRQVKWTLQYKNMMRDWKKLVQYKKGDGSLKRISVAFLLRLLGDY